MLHYQTHGDPKRETVCFLHGFMGSSADWSDIVDALSGTTYCVTVDLPGHGGSVNAETHEYSMEGVTQSLADILDEIGVDAARFARLGEDVSAVLEAGADIVHFDVMDNHYVPNLTIGPLVCEALRNHGVTATIDVHLMVKPVDRIIGDFAAAGADWITFHPEASEHVDRSLALIREHGCKAGLVFNPATPLDVLRYVADKVDIVLLMSVNPGFGGQAFIPGTLTKLQEAREWIDGTGRDIRLEVDGGIKVDNIGDVAAAGADTFVAGSAIFGADDYSRVVREMRDAIAQS